LSDAAEETERLKDKWETLRGRRKRCECDLKEKSALLNRSSGKIAVKRKDRKKPRRRAETHFPKSWGRQDTTEEKRTLTSLGKKSSQKERTLVEKNFEDDSVDPRSERRKGARGFKMAKRKGGANQEMLNPVQKGQFQQRHATSRGVARSPNIG